ncbi:MAG TPA: hypothetical protein VKB88_17155, partial [Bryobacteraceae bacterium]|nr:hypothetical protein [Bryobacteraceae bacterium]
GPARRGSMDVVGKTISNETENESSSVGHSPPHPAAKLTGALAALKALLGESARCVRPSAITLHIRFLVVAYRFTNPERITRYPDQAESLPCDKTPGSSAV